MREMRWMGGAGLLVAALQAWAGYDEGMAALGVRDYVRARAEFEGDRANPKSVFQLARMARLGLGEPPSETRATNLLAAAAEQGHDEARLEYAYALGNGRGTARDGAKAVQLLQSMVDAGNVEAQVTLGRVLRYGWWGQPRDESRGVALFEKAMAAGDDTARALFGLALIEGVGVAKDEARGAQLLREGSERGHHDSQLEYARMLTFGLAVPKDEAAGFELYRKVAERGDRLAQYSVGLAYLRGRGVARDDAAAIRWLDAAARQGMAHAQLQLGDQFRLGEGVPRMRGEAYVWYSIAAAGTVASVAERANTLRADMARDLPEADIARYVKRAEAFKPQPGFRPRAEALPALARSDRITVGGASLSVPLPAGYANGWELAESFQRAFPNDPALRPLLMVLNNREDLDRMKLGMPGPLRGVEVGRHLPDDTVVVSPKLFAEVKGQLRGQIENNVANGRFKLEETVRDDERAYAVVRSGIAEPNRLDAVALVLVKEKVINLAFTGFTPAQKGEVVALVKAAVDAIVSANRTGFFSP